MSPKIYVKILTLSVSNYYILNCTVKGLIKDKLKHQVGKDGLWFNDSFFLQNLETDAQRDKMTRRHIERWLQN